MHFRSGSVERALARVSKDGCKGNRGLMVRDAQDALLTIRDRQRGRHPPSAAMTKLSLKLMEEDERPANGLPAGRSQNLRRGRERVATGTPEDASDRRALTMGRARVVVGQAWRSTERVGLAEQTAV